ncbi:MAG: SseB family protein [Actinomycetota bacterium]
MSDSAGTPWAGRRFEHGAASDDDGSAPAALTTALEAFRAGEVAESRVVDAVRGSRLLIPLVARHGGAAPGARSAELSIVTVAGPDGRVVMPVFSSVETMRRWKPLARPVPMDAVRVALAAASEGTELVVLDAASVSEFVIRRPALWAIAQSQPWTPSYLDDDIQAEFRASAGSEPAVASVSLTAGDPEARLAGPELEVVLAILPGLSAADVRALTGRLRTRWAESQVIAARVDSLVVRLVTDGT